MFYQLLIINTLISGAMAYIIYFFLKLCYDFIISSKKLFIYIFVYGISNGLVVLIWQLVPIKFAWFEGLRSIAVITVSIIVVKYLLCIDFKLSLLSFAISGIGLLLGSTLFSLVLFIVGSSATPEDVPKYLITYIVMNVFINIFDYFFILLLYKLNVFDKLKHLFKQFKFFNPMILNLITFLLFMSFNTTALYVTKSIDPVFFIVFSILIIMSSGLAFWNLYYYKKAGIMAYEITQQKFYNSTLDSSLQELRRIKHDTNNHLYIISSMLERKKLDEAYLYLKEICATNELIGNTAVLNIKNAGLFGIIASKQKKADDLNIIFKLTVIGIVESIPNVKISELCEVIGIYLDNAIEAAQDSKERSVEVTITALDSSITIDIKNSCECKPDLEKIKSNGFSTKGPGRGNGLFIAEKIINRYKNILKCTSYDEEYSSFSQTLYIEKEG